MSGLRSAVTGMFTSKQAPTCTNGAEQVQQQYSNLRYEKAQHTWLITGTAPHNQMVHSHITDSYMSLTPSLAVFQWTLCIIRKCSSITKFLRNLLSSYGNHYQNADVLRCSTNVSDCLANIPNDTDSCPLHKHRTYNEDVFNIGAR